MKHIGDFVSTRSGGACIAGLDHTGIEAMGKELLGWGYLQYSTANVAFKAVEVPTGRASLVFLFNP